MHINRGRKLLSKFMARWLTCTHKQKGHNGQRWTVIHVAKWTYVSGRKRWVREAPTWSATTQVRISGGNVGWKPQPWPFNQWHKSIRKYALTSWDLAWSAVAEHGAYQSHVIDWMKANYYVHAYNPLSCPRKTMAIWSTLVSSIAPWVSF